MPGRRSMATEAKARPITVEEYMEMDLGEGLHELVRGEIVDVAPPGPSHGFVCANATYFLGKFGRETGHGYSLSNDTVVITERDPDTVRGGDVLYYSNARWPRARVVGTKLPPVVPDLIVEVYSPSNRPGEMREKVAEYLNAGVMMVWVLYPDRRRLTIDRADDPVPIVLGEADAVEGLPELPGFRCPVADFFA
jgi:Uma2 family endonuclease